MDKLEEAFNALAAHIELHGKNGPLNGFIEVGMDLGMSMEDLSDGSDIHQVLSMEGEKAGKLTLIYLMVPVAEEDPLEENYWLELSGAGSASHAKVWHFKDGQLADRDPIRKAA